MANSFTGTFSSPAVEAEFMAITDSVLGNQFKNERHITGISLPDVKTIGSSAFLNAPLTSISLPKVESIGRYAFAAAEVTSLDLPKLKSIGNYTFYFAKLTSLSIPEIETIGEDAFNSALITSISLPKAVTIKNNAFFHAQLTSLDLPKTTTIGFRAFNESPITSLSIPNVETIGFFAFGKAKLTTIDLPKATSVQSATFEQSPLTSFSIPRLTKIDDSVFKSAKFTELILTEITEVAGNAFSSSPLTKLDLPQVTAIGDNAFTSIVNAASTEVIVSNKLIDTDAKKDKIFGAGNWDQINFVPIPDNTWIYFNGKLTTKPYMDGTKKITYWIVDGKRVTLSRKIYTLQNNGKMVASDGTELTGESKALVIRAGATGGTYRQQVYGKTNVELRFFQSTGDGNYSLTRQVAPTIPNTSPAKITFSHKEDNYNPGPAGWDDPATYNISIVNPDKSVDVNGINIPLDEHKMVGTVKGSGWWFQIWAQNTAAGTVILLGGGSGIGVRHTLIPTKIEV